MPISRLPRSAPMSAPIMTDFHFDDFRRCQALSLLRPLPTMPLVACRASHASCHGPSRARPTLADEIRKPLPLSRRLISRELSRTPAARRAARTRAIYHEATYDAEVRRLRFERSAYFRPEVSRLRRCRP